MMKLESNIVGALYTIDALSITTNYTANHLTWYVHLKRNKKKITKIV